MSSGSKNTSGIGAVGLCRALTEAPEARNQRAAADAALRAYLKHQADALAMSLAIGQRVRAVLGSQTCHPPDAFGCPGDDQNV